MQPGLFPNPNPDPGRRMSYTEWLATLPADDPEHNRYPNRTAGDEAGDGDKPSLVVDYGEDGYSLGGFDRAGFNKRGRNADGIDREGFDQRGYSAGGFDRQGYDRDGYNPHGFDRQGYDRDGKHREPTTPVRGDVSPTANGYQ